LQPVVAETVLSDPVLVGQGFIARCLLASPESTVGNRLYIEADLSEDPAMRTYHARMRQLLELAPPLRPNSRNELEPRALKLTPKAKGAWMGVHDLIEKQCGKDGRYAQISAFAAKAPEQVLRIAGVIAMTEAPGANEVAVSHVISAAKLVAWYLTEAVRLVSVAVVPSVIRNAEALLEWCHRTGRDLTYSTDVLQRGPSCVRSRNELVAAMAELERAGWATRLDDGAVVEDKPRRTAWRVRPA